MFMCTTYLPTLLTLFVVSGLFFHLPRWFKRHMFARSAIDTITLELANARARQGQPNTNPDNSRAQTMSVCYLFAVGVCLCFLYIFKQNQINSVFVTGPPAAFVWLAVSVSAIVRSRWGISDGSCFLTRQTL